MPCYHPLKGYRRPDGGWTSAFNRSTGSGASFSIPCRQCVGCRLERSRQWAVRCVHESKLYAHNSFVTLTYDDDNLPHDLSLHYRHFQLFMKRLRKRYGSGIRFYMCGEYGEQFGRPHFHCILFNFSFPDQYYWADRNGNKAYRSRSLDGMSRGSIDRSIIDADCLWPRGNCEIGSVTFQSAGYISRYCMKKVTGHHADDHYEIVHPLTGEVFQRTPEFNRMSLKPGIGKGFFDKFMSDMYPHDYVIVNGAKCKPPRYYDANYEALFPEDFAELKKARVDYALSHLDDNTPIRLEVKEAVTKAKISHLKRTLT